MMYLGVLSITSKDLIFELAHLYEGEHQSVLIKNSKLRQRRDLRKQITPLFPCNKIINC